MPACLMAHDASAASSDIAHMDPTALRMHALQYLQTQATTQD